MAMTSIKSIAVTDGATIAVELEGSGKVQPLLLSKGVARLLGVRLTALASRPADPKQHAAFQVKNIYMTPIVDGGVLLELALSELESIPVKLTARQVAGLLLGLQRLAPA